MYTLEYTVQINVSILSLCLIEISWYLTALKASGISVIDGQEEMKCFIPDHPIKS